MGTLLPQRILEWIAAAIGAFELATAVWQSEATVPDQGATMSKRARKRRSRKGNAANHGRKPNC